ncbi:MAG: hypothetical protein LC687_02865 [Actinobacteria bacterium]|nr:hypothetical protein [Actinomycetota bacterium]
MSIEEVKKLIEVENLAWEAYKFGCQNPRDVDHPDTPAVFELWYENIYKNYKG